MSMVANGVTGKTYGVDISVDPKNPYVKVAGEIITTDSLEVSLFLKAYRMGRDHKKLEIQAVLGIT
jgi:hypothetical protein